MTANDVDVLIHYYVCASDHPRVNAPAVRESINMFLNDKIFEEVGEGAYQTTLKGNAFVRRILDVKYPELKWTYEREDA